ncbi:hypothetical protein Dsin_009767, partial [Dipteronia sinensis]
MEWVNIWAVYKSCVLPRSCSDQSPLVVSFSKTACARPKPFQFQPMWFLNFEFMALVRGCWNSASIFGCPSAVLQKKLKFLKSKLKYWNKNVFGNAHDKVRNAMGALSDMQSSIASE